MQDITILIQTWILCCNDVWGRWFLSYGKKIDDFEEVESALFCTFVLNPLKLSPTIDLDEVFYSKLRVRYLDDAHESRQVCIQQRGGNVFCKPEVVALEGGREYRVRNVDVVGVMMDGHPYVEVVIGQRFILESPENLRFFFCES